MNGLDAETSDRGSQLDGIVRENPTQAILWALGAGFVLAWAFRALRHRPAEHRASRLLENLREQLGGLAQPAIRRASAAAMNGADLAHDRATHLSKNLDRHFDSVTSKLRGLFR